jgi:hypothetical protein
MNQEHIKQQKIDSILVKVQNDLLLDIRNADMLIMNYIRKDSITNHFIGGNCMSNWERDDRNSKTERALKTL